MQHKPVGNGKNCDQVATPAVCGCHVMAINKIVKQICKKYKQIYLNEMLNATTISLASLLISLVATSQTVASNYTHHTHTHSLSTNFSILTILLALCINGIFNSYTIYVHFLFV